MIVTDLHHTNTNHSANTHYLHALYDMTVTDLQAKVEELKVNNEYQLKLKEMSYTEKIKSLTEKFTLEIELSRHKLEVT